MFRAHLLLLGESTAEFGSRSFATPEWTFPAASARVARSPRDVQTSRRPDAAERRSTPQAPVTAEQVTSGRPNELTRSEARSVSPPDRDRDPARRCRGITRRFSLGQLAWHFMDIFAQRAKRCRLLVYVKRDGRLFVMAPSCTSELTCTKRCSE